MSSANKFFDDLAIEIVRININEAEYERRVFQLMKALLEIDEILEKREIAAREAKATPEAA